MKCEVQNLLLFQCANVSVDVSLSEAYDGLAIRSTCHAHPILLDLIILIILGQEYKL
jgi:hypothetical protein